MAGPTQKKTWRVKKCGCDCATMPENPCEPCGAGAFEIQWSSRAGSATLCGFSEYVPIVPPRKYRIRALGGRLDFTLRSGSCAADPFQYATVEMSGSCEYTLPGCTLQANGTQTLTVNGVVTTTNGLCAPSVAECVEEVETATQRLLVAKACAGGGSFVACTAEGSLSETLNTEDTEEAAMGRAVASWSSWAPYQNGVSSVCTTKTVRGAGNFTVGFNQARYRIRAAGTTGTVVSVALTFQRGNGSTFLIVRQFFPTTPAPGAPAFPSDPEAGWEIFTIDAPSGDSLCLIDARRYNP